MSFYSKKTLKCLLVLFIAFFAFGFMAGQTAEAKTVTVKYVEYKVYSSPLVLKFTLGEDKVSLSPSSFKVVRRSSLVSKESSSPVIISLLPSTTFFPENPPPLLVAPPAEETSPSVSPAATLTPEEEQLVNLINAEREKEGVAPLKVDPALVATARLKSKDLVVNQYFAHQSPTYGSPFEMFRAAGITYRYAGENLAGALTVERAHALLLQSPGHRANMINPLFTRVGVGITSGGSSGKVFVEHFAG